MRGLRKHVLELDHRVEAAQCVRFSVEFFGFFHVVVESVAVVQFQSDQVDFVSTANDRRHEDAVLVIFIVVAIAATTSALCLGNLERRKDLQDLRMRKARRMNLLVLFLKIHYTRVPFPPTLKEVWFRHSTGEQGIPISI